MKKLILLSVSLTLAITNVFAQLNVSVNNPVICNGSTATLTATAAGGTPQYSYSWNTSQTTSSIIVNPSVNTTYTITVTDNTPSTFTAQGVVTVNPKPNVSASGGIVCQGECISIWVTGGQTYTWSNYSPGSVINVCPSFSTTYTVTGTDGNGCTNSSQAVVAVNMRPNVYIFGGTVCQGSCTTVQTSGGFMSYSWSTGSTQSTITVCPSSSTIYSVTVMDINGCTNWTSNGVSVFPLPNVTASGGTIVCIGGITNISAGGASTYTWSNSYTGSTITVNPTQTTSYTVTGTNPNGCTNTATCIVTVNNQLQNFKAKGGTICNSTPLTISASGADNYTWSDGLGTGSSQTVFPTITTTYTVTGSNTLGCTATAEVVVYLNSTLVLSAKGNEICKGSSGIISVSGGDTYTWSNSLTNDTINVSPSVTTTYTVTGTNAAGCTGTAQAVVVVNLRPHIFTNDKYICYGNSTTLVASGEGAMPPYTYTWTPSTGLNSTSGNSVVAHPSVTTKYIVIITDSKGCTNFAEVIVYVNVNCINAGKVYYDTNNNGVKDAGEPVIPNIIVEGTPGPIYSVSDNTGRYYVPSDGNTYTVAVPNPPTYHTVNPLTNVVNGINDTLNDFGLHCKKMHDLRVFLNTYDFTRPGFPVIYYISYLNVANDTMSGEIKLVFDHSKLTYNNSSPTHIYASNDTVKWSFINLKPKEYRSICVNLTVSPSLSLNDVLYSVAYIYPIIGDTFPSDNIDSLHRLVNMSWDPNEKEVSKESLTPEEVLAEPYLTYIIYFQNTGNDTAFTVVLRDTLSNKLNIPTLETVASSHPYTFTIRGSGICEWKFNNILLPDSNVNEPKSHGFVKYRIKPKSNLLLGDSVTNKAYIYFDYNQAVITNTAKTLIKAKAGVCEKNKTDLNFSIFPNPFTTQTQITYSLSESADVKLEAFNILGEKINTIVNGRQNAGNYKYNFSGKDIGFSKGVYFIKLQVKDKIAYKKVVEM